MSKIKNTSRRLSREIVLQALYAYELNKIEKKSDVFLKKNFDFIKSILKDHKIDDNGKKFINKLFSLNIEKSEWSRNQIEEKLENSDITRVATIDLLILNFINFFINIKEVIINSNCIQIIYFSIFLILMY